MSRSPLGARVRAWPLWALPRVTLAYVLGIDAIAIALTVALTVRSDWTITDVWRVMLWLALSVTLDESINRTDRLRRYVYSPTGMVNASSTWQFGAILSMHIGPSLVVVAVVYIHAFVIRVGRDKTARPHRLFFSWAAAALTGAVTYGTFTVLRSSNGFLNFIAILVVMVVFQVVNQSIVSMVVNLMNRPRKFSWFALDRDEQALELATVVIGIMTAQCIIYSPWLSPSCLLVLVMLFRANAAKHLEIAAKTDAKTGLLNFTAWTNTATDALKNAQRNHRRAAILVIDLDHFRIINETMGHLGGDRILTLVGERLSEAVRSGDVVGRFGGDEFAVLLSNSVNFSRANTVAQRILDTLTSVSMESGTPLSATIGVAFTSSATVSLERMIEVADEALYQAKADGRGRIYSVNTDDAGRIQSPPVVTLPSPLSDHDADRPSSRTDAA